MVMLLSACFLQAGELRVVSWNMAWFPHGSENNKLSEGRLEKRIKQAAEQIRAYKPDILVLQELYDPQCAESLSAAMGRQYLMVICSKFGGFGADRENGRQQQCIIINSDKLQADCGWSEQWSSFGKFDPARGMVYAELLCGNQRIAVYGLHLKSNFMRKRSFVEQQKNMLKRELSITQLLNHRRMIALNEPQFVASIVAGDFNTDNSKLEFSSEATLNLLEEQGFSSGYENVPPNKRVTYPGRHAGCLDYIFVHSKLPQGSTTILPDPANISDHRPILRVINMP